MFGDAQGGVTLVDREFKLTRFQAFRSRTTHVLQLSHADVLVCVGDGVDPRPLSEQLRSRAVAHAAQKRLAAREAGGEEAKGGEGAVLCCASAQECNQCWGCVELVADLVWSFSPQACWKTATMTACSHHKPR